MIVTVNTDASFSAKHERGSYSCWIVCDEFKITKYGLLRRKCPNAVVAEFRSVINAMFLLFQQPTNRKIEKVVVNMDCLNVIHILTKDKKAIAKFKLKGEWSDYLYKKFYETVPKGVELDFRHVKAHSGVADKRSYVNEWCDTAAKKAMQSIYATN